MRTIKTFDEQNYQPHWKKIKRDSARAIIFQDNKLALVKSQKFGEYKFPGGGIENNESHIDTLIRETKEEAGLHILADSVKEYGKTIIIRKSTWAGNEKDEIFEQESFYYLCDVDPNIHEKQKLQAGYEKEYNYKLVYASLNEAITTNEKLLNIPQIPWVERDLTVMYDLKRGTPCKPQKK